MRSSVFLMSFLFCAAGFVFHATSLRAQPPTSFSSGSTGADGLLTYAPNLGLVYFPPAGLAQRANNIYNFTTITIGIGTTVRLSGWIINGPVYWVAQGDVTISGTLDLSGGLGHASGIPSKRAPSEPGAGGYSGGLALGAVSGQNATIGSGPGGGPAAGYNPMFPGYGGSGTFSGNNYLQPLIGGSGGGGAGGSCANSFGNNDCYGGGAGGGAILIASSTQIVISGAAGTITAQGGSSPGFGGGGSGGAIRLVSNTITARCGGVGASGGGGALGGAGSGIVRFEAFNGTNLGGVCANGTTLVSNPIALALPVGGPSTVSVTSINGTAINANPFSFPDIAINTGSPVPVVISGVNIPPGTAGNLYVFGETTADQTIPFTLAGTLQSTTATVNVSYPAVGSRGFAKVTWTGQ